MHATIGFFWGGGERGFGLIAKDCHKHSLECLQFSTETVQQQFSVAISRGHVTGAVAAVRFLFNQHYLPLLLQLRLLL